jgi:hypothetical protein
MMSGIELPHRGVRSQIGDGIHLLVHLERRQGKRIVTQVLAVKAYDAVLDRYDLEPIHENP